MLKKPMIVVDNEMPDGHKIVSLDAAVSSLGDSLGQTIKRLQSAGHSQEEIYAEIRSETRRIVREIRAQHKLG
jgi:hypothetical protein